MSGSFRFALATAPFPTSIDDGMHFVEQYTAQAAERHAELICFPESYLPGMRGIDEEIAPHSGPALEAALDRARDLAGRSHIAMILPMDWDHPDGIQNLAMVISAEGEILGYQTKNQLDPTEDQIFVPGNTRQLFDLGGVKFGVTICHEGFRYPESVRWAARQGASIVFHPQATGSNRTGSRPAEWRGRDNGIYEDAIVCRAWENSIYFASINYAFTFQKSATCVIGPAGDCLAYQPYGEAGLLVVEIDPELASGVLARRYKAGP